MVRRRGNERPFGEATLLSLPLRTALLRGRNKLRPSRMGSRHLGGENGARCAGEIRVRNGVNERKMK